MAGLLGSALAFAPSAEGLCFRTKVRASWLSSFTLTASPADQPGIEPRSGANPPLSCSVILVTGFPCKADRHVVVTRRDDDMERVVLRDGESDMSPIV